MNKTQRKQALKGVEELRKYDHVFLSVVGVTKISEFFGYTARSWLHKANPGDPKGLTLKNGATQALGRDATSLAVEICDRFNVPYDEKFGRGSQLRACCDALEAFFSKPGG